MSANFAVHQGGFFTSDESSWEETEPSPHPPMVRANKLLSHKKRQLYAKGRSKAKIVTGGRGRGHGGTVPLTEDPEKESPKSETPFYKLRHRAKKTAQRIKFDLAGTPKRHQTTLRIYLWFL